MPREIVHVSVGQCGNQIGHVFWKHILQEHNLKQDGQFNFHNKLKYEDFFKLDKVDVYFEETESKDKYTPRSILIDLEPGVIDKVMHSPIGSLFHPDFILKRSNGTGNNWVKGHYTLGAEIIDEAVDMIRKKVEACDQLQGFQLTHSIGGGTGSGFGTLLLEKLKDTYPDRLLCTWSIYPTQKVSDIVVEPYNALLTISRLIMDSDITMVSDNEALFRISRKILKQKNPTFADLNWILSLVMGGVTASLRFPGILNCDLRKMSVNLIPFPRLHFFISAYSPLIQRGFEYKLTNMSLNEISENVWNTKYSLAAVRNTKQKIDGKFLAASVMYRGRDVCSSEIENITKKYLSCENDQFVEWIPHNIKTSIINLKPQMVKYSATMIGNITSVKDCFERIWQSFDKLFSKKAFLHWYRNEGMHELEFINAENDIKDLIMELYEKQEIEINYNTLGNIVNDEEEMEEFEECEDTITNGMDELETTTEKTLTSGGETVLNGGMNEMTSNKCSNVISAGVYEHGKIGVR